MGLTAELARFAANGQSLTLVDEAIRRVRNGFIDTVAVMLAGRNEPVVQVVLHALQGSSFPCPESTVLMGTDRRSALDAALVNATAAQALDFDDVGLQGHPSAVLVPALLAEGERIHASGSALVKAYVVGFETWGELIGRDQDLHHEKGWHPTAVFGTLAVAAAVSSLRRLSPDLSGHALGIAASMAGGVVANFGSMTKPFHAGRAAANGIEAVNWAAAGMTASLDALERSSGLLAALSPRGNVDLTGSAEGLGMRLRLLQGGLNIKKYPVCFAAHRVIDGALDLIAQNHVTADQVQQLQVTVGTAQANMLRHHEPVDSLQAKFSLEFALAAALVARRLGMDQMRPEFIDRPDVRDIFSKVNITTTDTVCKSEPTLALSDRLVMQLIDGRLLDSGEILFARGTTAKPLTDHDLRTKFVECTRALHDIDGNMLYAKLSRLETLDDINKLSSRSSKFPGSPVSAPSGPLCHSESSWESER